MRIEYDSKSKQLRTITKDSTNRLRFEIHIDALSNSYVYQSSSRRMKQRFLNVLVMFFARFLNVLNPKMEQNRRAACQWCASDIFIVLAHHWQACAAFCKLTPRPANDAQVVGTMSQAHHWQAFPLKLNARATACQWCASDDPHVLSASLACLRLVSRHFFAARSLLMMRKYHRGWWAPPAGGKRARHNGNPARTLREPDRATNPKRENSTI